MKELQGNVGRYRVRSGRWHAVLERDKAQHTLTVIAVDDRKDVYRR